MHVYWASVLVIPLGIIHDIEQIMRGFLWCNGDLKKGRAKVTWTDICLPKHEGGLGLRSLEVFNLALMTTHLWNIASNRDSLWVRWIHMYKLRGRNIWEVHPRGDMSWGWRKILQLREYVKPFFWTEVGNGLNTSLWYDRWCSLGPLIRLLSPRDIYREGYSLNSCVADLVMNGVWNWPQAWLAKAPDIGSITAPNLMDRQDCLQWCDANGTKSRFLVKCAWEALRPRGVEVSWYNIVWFAHSIPRHSFNLWLIMRRSLKTQDNLRAWDVGPNVDLSMLRCPLCDTQRDSHEHLFFECAYSAKVWDYVRVLADLDNVPPTLMDIVATLLAMCKARTTRSIFGRLILAATTYFIWNERNNRLFNKINRKPEDIRDMIFKDFDV
ncbi:putative reverse transcriptase domain-containing protein [Tanacetum coccineum]|uniref:Reverse transcriptase domain-containing protein n=1 Tax=Tanacetum coccineum TaxID=301880 RepID=A0ABQ5F118_9ASTR